MRSVIFPRFTFIKCSEAWMRLEVALTRYINANALRFCRFEFCKSMKRSTSPPKARYIVQSRPVIPLPSYFRTWPTDSLLHDKHTHKHKNRLNKLRMLREYLCRDTWHNRYTQRSGNIVFKSWFLIQINLIIFQKIKINVSYIIT